MEETVDFAVFFPRWFNVISIKSVFFYKIASKHPMFIRIFVDKYFDNTFVLGLRKHILVFDNLTFYYVDQIENYIFNFD